MNRSFKILIFDNMCDRIIYVLCYDDISEQKAQDDFSSFPWARIYRIPQESQNHLFEGVMYTTELMKLYDEWKDKEFVGTISYKLKDRLNFYHYTTMNSIDDKICNTSKTEYNVVPFMYYNGSHFGELYPDVKNTYIYLTDTLVPIKQHNTKFGVKKLLNRETELANQSFFFFNYWMATPSVMLDYVYFFNSTWLPALESMPNVWNNSGYKGKLSPNECKKLTTRADYYPYHPFINERLPATFFRNRNYKIFY